MPIVDPGLVSCSFVYRDRPRLRRCFERYFQRNLGQSEIENLGVPAPVTKMLAGLMSR